TLGRAAGRDRLLALVARDELDDLLAHAVEVRTELAEHLRSHALALTDEAEEDVLGADVVVAELESLAQRELEHLLGARGEGNVARRRLLALADDLLHLGADGVERDAERVERLRGDTFTLVDQAQEDVLGADVVVVEHPRLFLGKDDHPTCTVGESLEHTALLLVWAFIDANHARPPGLPVFATGVTSPTAATRTLSGRGSRRSARRRPRPRGSVGDRGPRWARSAPSAMPPRGARRPRAGSPCRGGRARRACSASRRPRPSGRGRRRSRARRGSRP